MTSNAIPDSDMDIPRDILGFRTITSMLALLGAPKIEIDDHLQEPQGLHVLNSLATLLVRQHEIVAVVVDEESIPDTVNVIVCLEGEDTLMFSPQYVFPDSHIVTANPRDPLGRGNSVQDSLTHIGDIREPILLEETKVDIQLSDPWPHISATW
jgi:hypothetical protein